MRKDSARSDSLKHQSLRHQSLRHQSLKHQSWSAQEVGFGTSLEENEAEGLEDDNQLDRTPEQGCRRYPVFWVVLDSRLVRLMSIRRRHLP